jgi:hypothetical protein
MLLFAGRMVGFTLDRARDVDVLLFARCIRVREVGGWAVPGGYRQVMLGHVGCHWLGRGHFRTRCGGAGVCHRDCCLIGSQGFEQLEKPGRWSLWRRRCSERGRNVGWCRLLPVGRSSVEIDGCDGTVPLWSSRNKDFIAIRLVEFALKLKG